MDLASIEMLKTVDTFPQALYLEKESLEVKFHLAITQASTVFSLGVRNQRNSNSTPTPAIKSLTRLEKRLLTKAEKDGLLSAADKFVFSLSATAIEKPGLLSKAEELGVLSAATDTGTPAAVLSLSLGLLTLGPFRVYLVCEEYPWEIELQEVVALLRTVGGSAAFAASNFVSNLQKS